MDKTEKIGEVILNLSSYCGKDLYSEGDAEDELLRIVSEHNEDEYNGIIASSRSWSTLYHLSDIRENIADFLGISKSDSVLEIGAGCGAVTGVFARMAKKVTCVELSYKRSLINANRHKDFDNIEIMVGNFQDIEKTLTEKYDYITLIGVLEYAGSYIEAEDPYETLLSLLKPHLKEGGCIVTAIENKYGLKYFAGCREDHTGGFFDGIEGYVKTDAVRTFSKDGLFKLASKQGFKTYFYYPYPDYKLPVTIYSDDRLPAVSELYDNVRNFDNDRFIAFSESEVFDELIREGQFPFFSNSFLVLMRYGDKVEGIKERKTVYSRHSIERRPERQIRTDMELTESGQKIIAKYPVSPRAEGHLENMARAYERLLTVFRETRFKPNRMKRINDGEGHLRRLEFEFLKGPTLSDELGICRAEKKTEDALLLINSYCDTLRNLNDMQPFKMTDEFKEMFGEVSLPAGLLSMPVTDLDLTFTNLISDKGWNIIDYEWTFDFPIPVDFVIYRAIYYFTRDLDEGAFEGVDFFVETGIGGQLKETFKKMEYNFQMYIRGDRFTLPVMYSIMGRETLELDRAVKTARLTSGLKKPRLYYDLGRGYNEQDTLFIDAKVKDDCIIHFETVIPEGCRTLRIDPIDKRCILRIRLLENEGKRNEISVNGTVLQDNTIIFDTVDPQIIIDDIVAGRALKVEYEISMLPEDMFEDVVRSYKNAVKPVRRFRHKNTDNGYVRLVL
ncbi:MAG: methyltransferase [Lachnospiraceae bacterium]|nr:methyltransferase [Lachnospiraceae bacterium]